MGSALFCRQMSSAAAEAEKLKAAGDAHKRDLVQAKLVEREAELAAVREKLWAANREASSESPADSPADSCCIRGRAAQRPLSPVGTATGPELPC